MEKKEQKKSITRRDFLFKTLALSSGFTLLSIIGPAIEKYFPQPQALAGCCYGNCYSNCHGNRSRR